MILIYLVKLPYTLLFFLIFFDYHFFLFFLSLFLFLCFFFDSFRFIALNCSDWVDEDVDVVEDSCYYSTTHHDSDDELRLLFCCFGVINRSNAFLLLCKMIASSTALICNTSAMCLLIEEIIATMRRKIQK